MIKLKRKQMSFAAIALFGFGYFTTFSSLELNFFLRGYLAVMPLQAAALIYFTYQRYYGWDKTQ